MIAKDRNLKLHSITDIVKEGLLLFFLRNLEDVDRHGIQVLLVRVTSLRHVVQNTLAIWQDVHCYLEPAMQVHFLHVEVRLEQSSVYDEPVKRSKCLLDSQVRVELSPWLKIVNSVNPLQHESLIFLIVPDLSKVQSMLYFKLVILVHADQSLNYVTCVEVLRVHEEVIRVLPPHVRMKIVNRHDTQ